MIRGTTPTLCFKLKSLKDFSTISDIWITLVSGKTTCNLKGHEIEPFFEITKKLSDKEIIVDEDNLIVKIKLSQKETLRFKNKLFSQIKVILQDETVCASKIFEIPIEEVLNTTIMEVKDESEEEKENNENQ